MSDRRQTVGPPLVASNADRAPSRHDASALNDPTTSEQQLVDSLDLGDSDAIFTSVSDLDLGSGWAS